jgi:hypothetical protein
LPGFDIETVPDELLSQEICFNAINSNRFNLKSIPPRFVTQEMCVAASTQFGFKISQVPKQFVTFEICKNALEIGHARVKDLPAKFISTAVKFDRRDAKFFRLPLSDTIFVHCAVVNNSFERILFDKLPEKMRTSDMAIVGLSTWGYNLGKIPVAERTYDLCTVAVKSGQVNFDHIPLSLWDRDLVHLAATRAYGIVRFLEKADSRWLTKEVVITAVSNGKESLDSVPDRFIDRELCLLAVKASYQAIRFVPEAFFDDELARIAIASDRRAEQFVSTVRNVSAPTADVSNSPYPKWHADARYVRSLQTIFFEIVIGSHEGRRHETR